MAKAKENLFGSFGIAVQQRQQEQERIEARVTGQAAPEAENAPAKPGRARKAPSGAAPLGRPRKRMDATTMTICISREDKDLVKSYAFAHAMTVSDLIHKWVQAECAGSGGEG